jgi:hypothetical protein
MILLDANVIIDFWHEPTKPLTDLLRRKDICICGPVLAELMHGARDERELAEVQSLLGGLPQLGVSEAVWGELGRNLHALRKAGLKVPFQDVLLVTVAVMHDAEVWTNDSHFPAMQQVLSKLRLFAPGSTD